MMQEVLLPSSADLDNGRAFWTFFCNFLVHLFVCSCQLEQEDYI